MENKKPNIVYLNPNFSHNQSKKTNDVVPLGRMHINPNFKGNINKSALETYYSNAAQSTITPKIYVNPSMLKVSGSSQRETTSTLHRTVSHINSVTDKAQYIVNSKNKFVKVTTVEPNHNTAASMLNTKPLITANHVTKKPLYSLVRKDTTTKSKPPVNIQSTSDKCLGFNQPLKLSKNNIWKKKSNTPPVTYSSYSIRKRKASDNSSKLKQRKLMCHKYKLNNKCLSKMSQVYLLNKSISYGKTSTVPPLLKNISTSVFIGGEKYFIRDNVLHKVGKSKISLKQTPAPKLKQVKKINLCGITYVRKSDNIFVMDNRMKNLISKRKKINITCPVYRRLGVCKKHNEKKCPLVHDPKNISICQKFLKGLCAVDGCHLSHQVVLEKMPTCRFFLEGCCVRENCPYLHVKVNQSAKICVNFLNGYCEAGVNCDNKHINVCPNIYKYSRCDKIKCPYPHKLPAKTREPELLEICQQSPSYSKVDDRPSEQITLDKNSQPRSMRYFEENEEGKQKADTSEDGNVLYKGQSKLGDLPSFISLS